MLQLIAQSMPWLSEGAFLHWLMAVGVTLLLLDVFLSTEILSWVSISIFASWGTWRTGLPLQWSVLVFAGYVAVGFAFYYALWVRFVRPLIGVIMRPAPPDDLQALVGRRGTIVGGGSSLCVKVQDELWAVDVEACHGLEEGDFVSITGIKNGMVSVTKVDNASPEGEYRA